MDQEITTPRPVQWVGDSRERLQAFPEPVRKEIDLIKRRLRRAKEMEGKL